MVSTTVIYPKGQISKQNRMPLSTWKQTAVLKNKTGEFSLLNLFLVMSKYLWSESAAHQCSCSPLWANSLQTIWRSRGESQCTCELVATANFSGQCLSAVPGHRVTWPFLCVLMEGAIPSVSSSLYEDTSPVQLGPHSYFPI